MTIQTSKSLIAQEIKSLNFLLQNPKNSENNFLEVLQKLQAITSSLKEKI